MGQLGRYGACRKMVFAVGGNLPGRDRSAKQEAASACSRPIADDGRKSIVPTQNIPLYSLGVGAMLLRAHVFSTLMFGAGLSLSSCSGADWRSGVEKPEDCVVRLNKRAGFLSQPAGQSFYWVPTFTFDITQMGKEAVDELVASTGARIRKRAMGVPSSADTTIPALVYWEADASFFRLRDRPVAIPNAAAAGCALQRPNMRLVNVVLEPPPR